jgi:hypothetical protein
MKCCLSRADMLGEGVGSALSPRPYVHAYARVCDGVALEPPPAAAAAVKYLTLGVEAPDESSVKEAQ